MVSVYKLKIIKGFVNLRFTDPVMMPKACQVNSVGLFKPVVGYMQFYGNGVDFCVGPFESSKMGLFLQYSGKFFVACRLLTTGLSPRRQFFIFAKLCVFGVKIAY